MINLNAQLQAVQNSLNDPATVKKAVKQLWSFAMGILLTPSAQEIEQLNSLIKRLHEIKPSIPKDVAEKIDLYVGELITKKILWATPVQAQTGHCAFFFNGDPEPLYLSPFAVESLRQESPFFKKHCSQQNVCVTSVSKKTLETLLAHLHIPALPELTEERTQELLAAAEQLELGTLAKMYRLKLADSLSYAELYQKLLDPATQSTALHTLMTKESHYLFVVDCFQQKTFETYCNQQGVDVSALAAKLGAIPSAILFPHHQLIDKEQLAEACAKEILSGNGDPNLYRLFATVKRHASSETLLSLRPSKKPAHFLDFYMSSDMQTTDTHADRFDYPTIWRERITEKMQSNPDYKAVTQEVQSLLDTHSDKMTGAFKEFCQVTLIKCLYAQDKLTDAKLPLDQREHPSDDYFKALLMLGDYHRFYTESADRELSLVLKNYYYAHMFIVPVRIVDCGTELTSILHKLKGTPCPILPNRQPCPKFSNQALSHANQGWLHSTRKEPHHAIEAYSLSLAIQRNPGIAFRRALCYWSQGLIEPAKADLATISVAWPAVHLLHARMLLKEVGFDAAKQYLRENLKDEADFAPNYFELLLDADRISEAKVLLEQFQADLNVFDRAQAYERVEEYIRAVDLLVEAYKSDSGNSEQYAKKLKSITPKIPRLILEKSDIQRWYGDRSEVNFLPHLHTFCNSLECFDSLFSWESERQWWGGLSGLKNTPWEEKGIKLYGVSFNNPSSTQKVQLKKDSARFSQTIQRLSDYLIAHALEDAQGVITNYEANKYSIDGTPYRAFLADTYRALGQLDRAKEVCSGDQGGMACQAVKAFICLDEGKPDEAIPLLEGFLEEGCVYGPFLERAQVAYYQLTGKIEFNRKAASKARHPELIKIYARVGPEVVEQCYYDHLQKAVYLFPDDQFLLAKYLRALIDSREYTLATTEAQQFLARFPTDKEIRSYYGALLYFDGHFKEALAYLSPEFEMGKLTLPVSYILGDSYHLTGDAKSALEMYAVAWNKLWNKTERKERCTFQRYDYPRQVLYWKRLEAAKALGVDNSTIIAEARQQNIKSEPDRFFQAHKLYETGQYAEALALFTKISTFFHDADLRKMDLASKMAEKCYEKGGIPKPKRRKTKE